MNKLFIALFSAAALFVTSCTTSPIDNQTDNQPSELPFTPVKSSLVVRDTVPANQTLTKTQAQDNNEFAIAMYKKLVEEGKNCFFSPYSISTALAMTAAGAANNTFTEMRQALQATLPGVQFDEALNSIDLSLGSYADKTDGITFKAVNSTWMQTDMDFRIGFLNHLAQYYGAGMNLLDFRKDPDGSRLIINDWVAEQTNEKILNLLPEGSIKCSTAAVLTNAVYFLADWKTAFDASQTTDSYFRLQDNSSIQTPAMYYSEPGNRVEMPYIRRKGVRAMDFAYKGDRFVMTVLMPDIDSLPSFEKSLSAALLDTLFIKQQPESLSVYLPKFKFTYGSKEVTSQLKTLGMQDAFDEAKADFSAMSPTSLFISKVFHKAFIEVHEAGTEAAAATAVVMEPTSINNDKVIFNVNRPFIFVIRDKETGTILFMGRILNPTIES